MSYMPLIIGALVVVAAIAAVYAFLSDPEEVDREELSDVRRETAKERQEQILREKAREEEERVKEMEEYPSGN